MIVVAIVAILASIALPAYQDQVRRGHRAAAQTQMMDIATRQQQFFLANRSYAPDLDTLNFTLPKEVSDRYGAAVVADNAATPPAFTITLTATDSQEKDGDLSLNSAGVKIPADKWK